MTLLKFLIFLPLLFALFNENYCSEKEPPEFRDTSVFFLDTVRMDGLLINYFSNKSSEIKETALRIFILAKEDDISGKESLKELLNEGVMFLWPSHFFRLMLKSPERANLSKTNYDEKRMVKDFVFLRENIKFKKGKANIYKVNAEFIVALVDVNFLQEVISVPENILCSNGYIKVITPNYFYNTDDGKNK